MKPKFNGGFKLINTSSSPEVSTNAYKQWFPIVLHKNSDLEDDKEKWKVNIFLPIERKLDKNSTFDKGQASAKNLKELMLMDPIRRDFKLKTVVKKWKVLTNFI